MAAGALEVKPESKKRVFSQNSIVTIKIPNLWTKIFKVLPPSMKLSQGLPMTKAALGFYFLLCLQQVNSSISLIPKYRISWKTGTEDDLTNFVRNLKIAYLEKRVPRHITVLGASAEDLPKIQLLFKSYPYTIFTDPKTYLHHSWFSPGSFVIIFLDDLREETFERLNVDTVSLCSECKVLYIFRGTIINPDGVSLLFTKTVKVYGVSAQLAHISNNVTKFYADFVAENCSIEGRLIVVWRPGDALDFIDTWHSSSYDLNGCPITVSTLNFVPKMLIEEQTNGSLTISGGLEGELILALAEKLNFTIDPRYPSMENRNKYSRKSSIIIEVATGRADIGIGRLRPTSGIGNMIAFSKAYDHDCVTWGVPRLVIRADNVVWIEFTWKVWILIGLVFAISCTIGSASHRVHTTTYGNGKSTEFSVTVLAMVAIHVGSPVSNVPYSLSGKFLMMICILYATVVTTAYKSSLASILATDDGSPGIIDTDGILKENLSVGGASYHLDVLMDQADGNRTISKLIDRFLVINEPSEVLRRLRCDKKFAGISRGSAMRFERDRDHVNRKSTTFNILEDCVLHHETAIAFRKVSPLREPANEVILRYIESGITDHWNYRKNNIEHKSYSTDNYLESSTKDKFDYIFFLYLCCVTFCLLAFLIEIGTSIIRKSGKIEFTTTA